MIPIDHAFQIYYYLFEPIIDYYKIIHGTEALMYDFSYHVMQYLDDISVGNRQL